MLGKVAPTAYGIYVDDVDGECSIVIKFVINGNIIVPGTVINATMLTVAGGPGNSPELPRLTADEQSGLK